MAALTIHRSERTEDLADALADAYGAVTDSVFNPPVLVVPGRGMAVWVTRALSRRLGVFVADRVRYPDAFLRWVMERALGRAPEALDAYARRRLSWGVLSALAAMDAETPGADALHRYVGATDGSGPQTGIGSLQLAERLADVFDRYLLFRPDWLRAWSAGNDVHASAAPWAPGLWRQLEASLGRDHIASLETELLSAPAAVAAGDDGDVPPAIFLFGFGVLPPLYLRWVTHLARAHDVHWFWPVPSRGYFADDPTPRARARALQRGAADEDAGYAASVPLLASLGRLGADQQNLFEGIREAAGIVVHEDDPPVPSGPPRSCLEHLQRDLRDAVRGPWEGVDPSDGSLRLHVCHGPRREVEVLQDQLLARLGEGDLAPHDVVVMCSDLERYGPLVEATFGLPRDDPRFIPYCVADRSIQSESSAIDAFFRVLALVGSRLRASELLDVLALEAVRCRFGVGAEELSKLRTWTAETGIRWGRDAAHRVAHGQPDDHRNTWRFGLERLLLGYALPLEGRALYRGRLPYDEVEGRDTELLGVFADFAERVFEVVGDLEEPRPVAAWRPVLLRVIDAVLDDGEPHASAIAQLQRGIADWVDAGGATAVPLGAGAVARSLEAEVGRQGVARGYLAQGVTFCAMMPMRAIPFGLVCLLGMEDGSFPRRSATPSFDLTAHAPRRGDRTRRDDDRYLFLEAITSARKALWISYGGRDPRTDEARPASTVVQELFDAVAHAARPADAEGAWGAMTVMHKAQPFDPAYFDGTDPRRFSFDRAAFGAAVARQQPPRATSPPFAAPLPAWEGTAQTVALEDLIRFFEAPVRYLFEQRIGVVLHREERAIEDRDPIVLDPLARYGLGQELLELRLADTPRSQLLELAAARGALPLGAAGEVELAALMRPVEPLCVQALALREGAAAAARESIAARLPSGVMVAGEVEVWRKRQVEARYVKVSGKQLVRLWLRHLLLNANSPRESHLVGRPDKGYQTEESAAPTHHYRFRPVDDAAQRLDDLLELYAIGQREPLLVFPRAGFALVRKEAGGKRGSVDGLWKKSVWARDPYVGRVFSPDASVLADDAQPFAYARLGPSFREAATRVFAPLVAALEILG
ncbi:MAG: exodeoxyribonuclease V subunit gamma [Myxococcota bacterium]